MPINITWGANNEGHGYLSRRLSEMADNEVRKMEAQQRAAAESARVAAQFQSGIMQKKNMESQQAEENRLAWARLQLAHNQQQMAYEQNMIDAMQRQQQIEWQRNYQQQGLENQRQSFQQQLGENEKDRALKIQMQQQAAAQQQDMLNRQLQARQEAAVAEMLDNEVSARRSAAKSMNLDWEGKQKYGDLAGKLRGIQNARSQIRPQQYQEAMAKWIEEFDNARLDTYQVKQPSAEEIISSRVKDLGNGYAMIVQPDGKIDVKEIVPQKKEGTTRTTGGQSVQPQQPQGSADEMLLEALGAARRGPGQETQLPNSDTGGNMQGSDGGPRAITEQEYNQLPVGSIYYGLNKKTGKYAWMRKGGK